MPGAPDDGAISGDAFKVGGPGRLPRRRADDPGRLHHELSYEGIKAQGRGGSCVRRGKRVVMAVRAIMHLGTFNGHFYTRR